MPRFFTFASPHIFNAFRKTLIGDGIRAGFLVINQKGSHVKLFNPATRKRTEIPMHPGDLGRKLIQKILKQAGISPTDFLKL